MNHGMDFALEESDEDNEEEEQEERAARSLTVGVPEKLSGDYPRMDSNLSNYLKGSKISNVLCQDMQMASIKISMKQHGLLKVVDNYGLKGGMNSSRINSNGLSLMKDSFLLMRKKAPFDAVMVFTTEQADILGDYKIMYSL